MSPTDSLSVDYAKGAQREYRDQATLLASAAIAVALAALILGWTGGIDFFVRIHPDYPAMVPETALSILLGGLGTLSLFRTGRDWLPQLCGLLIAGIVAVALLSPISLERLQTDDDMSIASLLGCLTVAVSLFLAPYSVRDDSILLPSLASLGLAVVTIPILGYLFNAQAMFANPIYTAMALHTAISLLCLIVALLLLQPRQGWVGIILAPEPGSQLLRRLLPLFLVGPPVLCMLTLYATHLELVSPDFRLALLAFAMIVLAGTSAIYFAHRVNLSERRTRETELSFLESERTRQATELAMVRTQKVEALGQLVGGVAHDFNNTLTVILGNLELLAEDPENKNNGSGVAEAIDAANHAAGLTRQLLAYGRKSRLEPEPHVLDDLVKSSLVMFRRICPANIAVTTRLSSPRAIAQIDSGNFQQALLNLLINARDAQPQGGRINVTSDLASVDSDHLTGFADEIRMTQGTYVTVTVADDGQGMDAATLARATEPFFTTKEAGEGSGLGLSMVSGFCHQSGGGLRIESAPGSGTTITMYFPLTGLVAPQTIPEPDLSQAPPAAGAFILVVDDEEAVTRVIARQLQGDGHQVTVAFNADQALERLAQSETPFDLVITDLVMPGPIQGHDLARRVIEAYPSTKVILSSGYESENQRQQIPWAAKLPFLQKPVSRATLRRVVTETLRQPPNGA